MDTILLILAATVLPVIINKTTERGRFEWIHPHLRWLWVGILIFFTYYLLDKPTMKAIVDSLHVRLRNNPLVGYGLASTVGIILMCLYWWATGWALRETSNNPDSTKTGGNSTGTAPPDLSEIQKLLEEIKKNTSRTGLSTVQMDAIKELDEFIVAHDENALREQFGFPAMVAMNITADIENLVRYRQKEPGWGKGFPPGEMKIYPGLAQGHIHSKEGKIPSIQWAPTAPYYVVLPKEFSDGKRRLLKFENSLGLPAPVIEAVKEFDKAIERNAEVLAEVLNAAVKKDQDYFLQCGKPPQIFELHNRYNHRFIPLRPKADVIKDAIRRFLGVN